MTNAELIAKIKAEIERLRLHFNKEAEKYQALNNGYSQNCYGVRDALCDLENCLSALKSEKPIDGLEEEIKRWWGEEYMKNSEGLPILPVVQGIARHFAEWQKEQDDKLVDIIYQQGIEKGKDDMKEQMMKEAVDADVMLTFHDKTGDISFYTGYLPKELGIKCDDKVHIIIIKEDKK